LQLPLADHINHDRSNPLVAIQFDATNAFFSIEQQSQFEVVARKASRTYDGGWLIARNVLHSPLIDIWVIFQSMNGVSVRL